MKKVNNLDELMKLVPEELPEGLEKLVWNQYFEHYILYNNRLGINYCTKCQRKIDSRYIFTNKKHNNPGICPHCEESVIYLCTGKFKADIIKHQKIFVRFVQLTKQGIVTRRVCFKLNIKNDYNRIEYWYEDVQRVFNDGQTIVKAAQFWEYYGNESFWRESKMTEFARKNSMGNYGYWPEYDFVNNMHEVISKSFLKYSTIKVAYDQFDYLSTWIRQCEYLEKAKLTNLAKALSEGKKKGFRFKTGNTLAKFLGLSNEYLKMVMKVNPTHDQFTCMKYLINRGIKKIYPEDIEWLDKLVNEYDAIVNEDGLAEFVSIEKLYKYFHTQMKIKGNKNNIISYRYYRDYLDACNRFGFEMTDKVLYPDNITQAHDREIKKLKIYNSKDKKIRIKERYIIDVKKYSFTNGEFFICPPKDINEILEEGKALNHCVGQYAGRVADGNTTILFVRRVTEPYKPFYTVEWKNNKAVQIRGSRNAEPTEEVAEFIKQWKSRSKKKIKVMAQAI